MIDDDEQLEVFSEDNNRRKSTTYQNNDEDIVELIHWEPVAKDVEFEKHIAKLKAMKQFNERR